MKGDPVAAANRKTGRRILHLLILAGVGLLAWKYIDFSRVFSLIVSADPYLVVGILLLSTVDRFLMAWKWRQLLRSGGVPVTIPEALSAYYQGSAVAYIPFMVAGSDVLRGYLVVKWHGRTRVVLATMIIEKVIGVISGSLLGVLGLAFVLGNMERAHAQVLAAMSLGGLAVGLALLAASLHEPFFKRLSPLLARVLPAGPLEKLSGLYEAYAAFRRRKRLLASNLGLTLVEQVVQTLMLLFAGLALGVDLAPTLFLAISALILLIRRFAIYVEGWGIAETMSVVLFGLVGLEPSTALTVSLLANGVALLAILPGVVVLARGPFRTGRAAELALEGDLRDGEAPGG